MMDADKLAEMTVGNAVALGKLIEITKRTSEDVDRLVKHYDKLEALSMEHSKILGEVGHLKNIVDTDRKKIKLVYSIFDYPKASLSLLVAAWSLTFYEVRAAIGIQLQPLVDAVKFIKMIIGA